MGRARATPDGAGSGADTVGRTSGASAGLGARGAGISETAAAAATGEGGFMLVTSLLVYILLFVPFVVLFFFYDYGS